MRQSHKIKWDISTGKLKDMSVSSYMEKVGDIQPEERKYDSEGLWHLRESKINTSGAASEIKQN